MIFAEEKLASILDEVQPLLTKHYEEIAWRLDKMPLDVDWKLYQFLEEKGKVVVYTARVDGSLAGYAMYLVMPNPHFKTTLFALNDTLYISKEYRRGLTVMRFIKWCAQKLKERGAQVITQSIRCSKDWSPVAKRIGFEPLETAHLMWVGN